MIPLGHVITVVDHDLSPIQFLIMDSPTETTLPHYLDAFHRYNVTTVVRCCQPTYNADILLDNQIDFLDLPFRDGGIPNNMIINEWIDLIDKYAQYPYRPPTTTTMKPAIAVHCVAGLGRAPVLVALALIEFGMAPLDAVAYVREKRRGAFNKPQIHFLDQYKPTTKHYRRHYSSSSSFSSGSSSVFSWGGRIMLKLTNKVHPPTVAQQ
ncbi:protein-tyrosine phosphatase-like protein [Halteromyces radiatus]|uniref:protein-tyrosine phosphatase-like protein n=1 Tax=Halteromyces radiatus TaxID=101107 RepID=UPI00221F2084|nr:protein-tyrosine phosphatase-like protein [Halteromyces radiatus]KAI8097516.1 protein-tyrosine phosphatase-like protein [Halteromyces radiatus]